MTTACSSSTSGDSNDVDSGLPDATSSAEAGPVVTVLASGQNGVEALATDGTSVYWTAGLDGTVMKAPASGGPAVTLATGQTQPMGIAVDATNVYWVSGDGTVKRAALDGTGATTLAAGSLDPDVFTLAIDTQAVYWTAHAGGAVMSVPLGGGTPTTLVSGESQPESVVVDATTIYWTITDCPEDGGPCAGAVRRAPLEGVADGGQPSTLAVGRPVRLAVDATSVYWTNAGTAANGWVDGAVMSVPLAGGSVTTLASGQDSPGAIAVDATTVYWATLGGTLASVPRGGGPTTTLLAGQAFPLALVVGSASLYWSDRGTGSVPGAVLELALE